MSEYASGMLLKFTFRCGVCVGTVAISPSVCVSNIMMQKIFLTPYRLGMLCSTESYLC